MSLLFSEPLLTANSKKQGESARNQLYNQNTTLGSPRYTLPVWLQMFLESQRLKEAGSTAAATGRLR